MPVFNGAPQLELSIKSILKQTYNNFEFIIIDDGSTDESLSIIRNFSDKRIIAKRFKVNSGIVQALNEGINIANGEYIARMDSDDISNINRLDYQIKYMEDNPEIGILGSSGSYIDINNKIIGSYPTSYDSTEIKWYSIFKSPFIHPSVVFRKSIINKYGFLYSDEFKYCEDFDLWYKILNKTKGENLNIPLINYRITYKDYDKLKKNYQITNTLKVALRNVRDSFPELNSSDDEIFNAIKIIQYYPTSPRETENGLSLLIELYRLFEEKNKNLDFKYLKRNFTTRISRKLFQLPLKTTSKYLINELSLINNHWIFDYFLTLPTSIKQRITNRKINKLKIQL